MRFGTDLDTVLTPAEIQALRQSLNTIPELTMKKQEAVQHAFAHAFRDQFKVCMYIGVACVIVSFAAFNKHPVSIKKRMEMGEAVVNGRIPPDEADAIVRGHH